MRLNFLSSKRNSLYKFNSFLRCQSLSLHSTMSRSISDDKGDERSSPSPETRSLDDQDFIGSRRFNTRSYRIPSTRRKSRPRKLHRRSRSTKCSFSSLDRSRFSRFLGNSMVSRLLLPPSSTPRSSSCSLPLANSIKCTRTSFQKAYFQT